MTHCSGTSARTTSVSRYRSGVSPYGVHAMVGNVWDWLATSTTPGRRELRGSAFTSPPFRRVPAIANSADETMKDDDTGFRCVATPEQMSPRKWWLCKTSTSDLKHRQHFPRA
ncbi:SUMF1/EgtB/PvdO family nonheme iron enzyme [Streptomyces sp. NPDC050564]|uniref:SUMF1/EgtB/PvdO family nonheme iron enzyme n=1 Tax=Streptomyces sp. NPDC050564 TaxID=3365631 RepID=UPI0037B9C0FA